MRINATFLLASTPLKVPSGSLKTDGKTYFRFNNKHKENGMLDKKNKQHARHLASGETI